MDLSTLSSFAAAIIATFLTASYTASAATEGLSSAFNLRGKLLLYTIRQLLNETHNNAPLTLKIYSNYVFNPRQPGKVDSLAAIKSLPAIVQPLTFASALMEAIEWRINMTRSQMEAALERNVFDEQLKSLAQQLIARYANDLIKMQLEIANWFERGIGHLADDYRRMTQGSNFVIGLVVAVVLGLDPIPPSLSQHAFSPLAANIAGYFLVAISTLFGAPFWYALLMKLVPIKPTGVNVDTSAPPPISTSGAGGATPSPGPGPTGSPPSAPSTPPASTAPSTEPPVSGPTPGSPTAPPEPGTEHS